MAWFARNRQTAPFVEQWKRAERWFQRLVEAYWTPSSSADDLMGLFYVVFQHCFHMRGWLLRCKLDSTSVDQLFARQPLRLCRDIANGTKHCVITKPSVDADFRTVREYEPVPRDAPAFRKEVSRLLAGGKKYDLYDLAICCMAEINNFLIGQGLFTVKSKLVR